MEKNYEEYWSDLGQHHDLHPGNRYRYRELKRFLKPFSKQKLTILDIGCGNGHLISKIKSTFPNFILFGTDVSQIAIASAKQKYPMADFWVADYSRQIPDKNIKLDVIILSEVIEHVEKQEDMIRNLQSTLKENGILYLSTQSGKRFKMDREVLGHLRHYSKKDIYNLLENNRFLVTSFKRAGFPILNIQKIVVDIFFKSVKNKLVVSSESPGIVYKLFFSILYSLMRIIRIPMGPQLFVTATVSQKIEKYELK